MPAKDRDPLQVEASRISYRLRSTFFYRKLKEYNVLALPAMIESLTNLEDLYNWDERAQWNISEDAFNYVADSRLKALQVFCHPKVIREHKALLAYYRNIAVLSQKAVNYLAGRAVEKYEADRTDTYSLGSEDALILARLYNEHISLIIDSASHSFEPIELNALLLASTGTQIDGSWRNTVGKEAENLVQRLILKEAVERALLAAFRRQNSNQLEAFTPEQAEKQLTAGQNYRTLLLKNQTSILFAGDPDVAVVDKDGRTRLVIEIKGGTDPAGALERYGAARKSFDHALQESSTIDTILIASCITTEVRHRIGNDPVIKHYYNLNSILDEASEYEEMMELIFSN